MLRAFTPVVLSTISYFRNNAQLEGTNSQITRTFTESWQKAGVTLRLLWNEYCESSQLAGEIPHMYTQFGLYYREWAGRTKATMRIHHKPGEEMEVDWAGQTMALQDNLTGSEDQSIHICVSVCRR